MKEKEFFYNMEASPFSNFYKSPFTVKGKYYPTAEHYYQSMKFRGTPMEEAIQTAGTSKAAHLMGHSTIDAKVREDWEEVKDYVYFEAVFQKFSQNEALKKILVETKNKEIVCVDTDLYWGANSPDGVGWVGKNTAGKVLMKVRNILDKGEKQFDQQNFDNM
eukprot:TRINITY_DN124748_c0_g1_i1.p1 TRINITY_DN124748_c0_g1~~TRINITY_DN124748_c0_g1_i1.p1  ORF type:complete len:162 (-),score=21.25 TRINITY_DN124748_c0_g1_i1:61-546(-)